MIMATKLLNQRIKDVMCARKRAGKADITPTLVDLERTHILYVNAHFKPFAAIGLTASKSKKTPLRSMSVKNRRQVNASTAPSARVCDTIKLREPPKVFSTTLRRRRAQWNPWETT